MVRTRFRTTCVLRLSWERSARLVACWVVTADTVPITTGVYKTIGEPRRCFPYMVLLAWVFLQRAPAVLSGETRGEDGGAPHQEFLLFCPHHQRNHFKV